MNTRPATDLTKLQKGTLKSKVLAAIGNQALTVEEMARQLPSMDPKALSRTMHTLAYDGTFKNLTKGPGKARYQLTKPTQQLGLKGNSGEEPEPVKVRKKYTRRKNVGKGKIGKGLKMWMEITDHRLNEIEQFLGK